MAINYETASAVFDEGEVLMGDGSASAQREAVTKFQLALHQLDQIGGEADELRLNLKGWCLLNIGIVHRWLEEYKDAETPLRQAASVFNLANNNVNFGRAYYELGHLRSDLEDYVTALDYYQEALGCFENEEFARCEWANIHTFIGGVLMQLGRTAEAVEHFTLAVTVYRDLDAYDALSETLEALTEAYEQLGFHQKAAGCRKEAQEIPQRTDIM